MKGNHIFVTAHYEIREDQARRAKRRWAAGSSWADPTLSAGCPIESDDPAITGVEER
jgi:hypothetical protein